MKKVMAIGLALLVSATMAWAAGQQGAAGGGAAASSNNLQESLDLFNTAIKTVKSTDGQLLMPELSAGQAPARPANPDSLPETNAGHWYDMEWAGWGSGAKINPPVSPKTGSKGKHIIMIMHGAHPWTTACQNGAQKAADALGMTISFLDPNWDINVQNQQIDQAINQKPDAIAIIPLDQQASGQQARKINQAGIPAFFFNTLPSNDAMRYTLTWTGPNDWSQMRRLARSLADKMGKKGGIAYITHNPGTSPYFARYWGPRTELATYAPDIKFLDVQTTNPTFDAPAAQQVTNDWLTRFGKDLTAIFVADDAPQALGVTDALKAAGREDILVVAAGNSKQGMDLVGEGKMYGITYQTAEGDGAAAVKSIAMFYNGMTLPEIAYLAQDIITKDNVAGFYPPQW
jgi:ribose transport system substrate-binding protein